MACLLTVLSPAKPASAEGRQALVIGNNDYAELDSLNNARRDAGAIAKHLAAIGFDVVTVLDGDLERSKRALLEFAGRLDEDTVSLFYYAGHGVQHDGVNFLMPTDYAIGDPGLLGVDAMALDDVVTRIAASRNRLAIYILDACRNNPFVKGRGAEGGLAPVDAPYGSFIAYATAPGHVAYDSVTGGEHGAFTSALLSHIVSPGAKLEDVFKLVRRDVVDATKEQQVPWTSSSVVGDFYFVPGDDQTESASAGTKNDEPVSALGDEYLQWAMIKESRDIHAFEQFISAFPGGDLYDVAALMRDRLLEERDREKQAAESIDEDQARSQPCGDCPDMVVIPPGRFQMGSFGDDGHAEPDEQPVHEVVVRDAFEISRHEITQAAFNEFVEATGYLPETNCGHPGRQDGDGFGTWELTNAATWWRKQDPDAAASCVSWLDAVSYARWLSDQTGDHYRLPTEAEWEYAARGGRGTERFWGDLSSEACAFANVYDAIGSARFQSADQPHDCSDGYAAIAPVGVFKPNPFDLHDVLGNVAEWVLDCRTSSYLDAPPYADEISDNGQCAYRTLRGGSWHSSPTVLRSAYRDWTTSITRGSMIGFRVVKTPGS